MPLEEELLDHMVTLFQLRVTPGHLAVSLAVCEGNHFSATFVPTSL